MAEDQDWHLQLFGHGFEVLGDGGGFLLAAVAGAGGAVEELEVVDDDEFDAVFALQTPGAGAEFFDFEVGGVVDVDGGEGEFVGGLDELGVVAGAEAARGEVFGGDVGAAADHAADEGFGGHFQAEDGDGADGLAAGAGGDVFGDVEGKGGFAHGGTGGGKEGKNTLGVLHNLVARRRKGGFPMIGKLFSNGWKNWGGFSNDWKNLSRVFQRLGKLF